MRVGPYGLAQRGARTGHYSLFCWTPRVCGVLALVIRAVKLRQPVLIVEAAGVGKSHVILSLADRLGMPTRYV
jgi:midasin (ATPase involved in ribosome maturation)